VPNAFMVRSDAIKKNKILFREKFGIMYEESDFAYRIRGAGYRIQVARGAKIYHDIESSSPDSKRKDYMYHFMNDLRRPYVFARNRIIFHSLYSNTVQMISILSFWIWVFTAYYAYKIICYSGIGSFSLARRVRLVLQYLKGDIEGLLFVIRKEQLSYP
jgi:GT2 family glycosyltransferase